MPLNDIFITDLHGVGPKVAERLKVLGIRTVKDLIYYLPREHEDLSVITSIIDIVPNKKITVRGTIERIRSSKTRWKRMNITEACIHDTTHQLRVTWFNQPYITESLKVGDEVLLSGTVKHTKQGLNLQSPEYEKVQAHTVPTHIGRIVPKYPLTAGVTQKQLRYFVKQSLKRVLPITDHLPQSLITRYHLLPLSTALQYIHFPESVQQFQEAKKRLNFDELFIVQLAAQLVRNDMQKLRAPILQFHEKEIKSFVQNLPFQLTTAQRKTSWSILQDIQKPHPMNRLLIGDVGSGKTVVAAMAMLNAVLNGFQAVLMAPTEILATQHAQYLTQLFKKQSIRVAVHTAHRKTAHHSINTPAQLLDADIIIGTHALIQEGITFQHLGLAVIDEQHRFGVTQRKMLKEQAGKNGMMPHLLSMSATPIPRTLALALYGDLDLSMIDELPAGRKTIITKIVPKEKRFAAYEFIQKQVEHGEQVFVICPLIEPSDMLGVKSVQEEFNRLHAEVFPHLRIALLHGKMKIKEKDAIMLNMRNKKIDILVATSVIEVGVDIPNATIMLIEGAERFGLAQLHQFRGRVGRANTQSYCFLFTDSAAPNTVKRLHALTTSQNGFQLAEYDLQFRGAGEMYGTEQSGLSTTVLTALQNPSLVELSKQAAKETVKQHLIDASPPLQERVNELLRIIHLE